MSNIEFNLKDAIISDIALNYGIGDGTIKLNNYNKEKFSNNLVESKTSFWKVASFATA